MEREAIAALAAVLGPLGISWVVIGAVAANLYRRDVRLTGDVDLLFDEAFVERWAEYWEVLDLWRRMRRPSRS